MNTDPYLATQDIEEKKIMISFHVRTHLPKDNMSYTWYRKNYPLWLNRALYIFDYRWNNVLRYTFTVEEINEWKKVKKEIRQLRCKKMHIVNTIYTKDRIIKLFKDEYIRLKSIPNFRHFSFRKYDKYRSKESPSGKTIIDFFGSLKSFYMQVTKTYPDIYFDPIKPYTEDDCEYALKAAYKKYGFVSGKTLNYNNGYISRITYINKYGSIENACKKFNIPYNNENLHSKIFLYVKKTIEELLPSIEIIEEKQWPKWLFYKDPLSIDMFLPLFNLAIEVDGKQHYDPKSKFWDKDQQIRDEIKNVKLPEHNITLMRIRDYEINKIPQILKPYVELLKTIQEYCAY